MTLCETLDSSGENIDRTFVMWDSEAAGRMHKLRSLWSERSGDLTMSAQSHELSRDTYLLTGSMQSITMGTRHSALANVALLFRVFRNRLLHNEDTGESRGDHEQHAAQAEQLHRPKPFWSRDKIETEKNEARRARTYGEETQPGLICSFQIISCALFKYPYEIVHCRHSFFPLFFHSCPCLLLFDNVISKSPHRVDGATRGNLVYTAAFGLISICMEIDQLNVALGF